MSIVAFTLEKYKIIGAILIFMIAAQLILVRPRWQFYPLYLLMAIYFILVVLNQLEVFEPGSANSKWIVGTGLFLIILSGAMILIFPKENIPVPTGPFKVGTRIYELEDSSREEFYTVTENDRRRIKYQVFYPAESTEGFRKSKWISDGTVLTRQLSGSFYLPSFVLDHTSDIDSNSYIDAPVNKDKPQYPVVVISHGWQGFRELHTDFAEELASHGFIAVSIDHTYGSQAVTFEDGTVAYLNEAALPPENDITNFSNSSNLLVSTYGEDVASVLDDLERKNQQDIILSDKMDLMNIGLMGHSTGGGGGVYISIKDDRIKSLLGLDAWVNPVEGKDLKQGLRIPALFLRSEQWSKGHNNVSLSTLLLNSDDSRLVQMNRTTHIDFTMAYMYSPLTKYIGFTGDMGRRKSPVIQREIALGFFDHYLRKSNDDSPSYLEEITNKYKDLKLID